MHVEVDCGTKDLHSGVFGGAVEEAMPDLIWLLDQLVNAKGEIMIPGIMDSVAPLDEDEKRLYADLDFCPKDFKSDAGCHSLRAPGSKESTLMNRWRYPALSIHGIEGAFADPGSKTVIPRKVVGKFSVRLVPNQDPVVIEKLINKYLKKKWAERGSGNKMTILPGHLGKPWMAKYNHPNYKAAAKAIEFIYKVKPQYTREGGSIPITLTFQELTGRNVLLLPMGQSDDGAHSQNEKISKRNYISGTKVFASYIHQVSLLSKDQL
jgi:nonspecific dipeptidase